MTPERRQRIEALYHAARELKMVERAVFLRQACAGDAELQGVVAGQLTWFDRKGTVVGIAGKREVFYGPFSISPDGTQIASAQIHLGPPDIWVLDLAYVSTRITTDPAPDLAPVWSPDGKEIVYGSGGSRGSTGDPRARTARVNCCSNPRRAACSRSAGPPTGDSCCFPC